MKCYLNGVELRGNNAQIDLSRSKNAGLSAQCFAIYIPTHDSAQGSGVSQTPMEYYNGCLGAYRREIEANDDLIMPALSVQDITDNEKAGKMSSILTVEDGVIVEGAHERLNELYTQGVRLITLTWNYENCFGYPQSKDPEEMKRGLKPFGIDAVRYMNELGIIADVSHLSEGGFDDVAAHSVKPFTASHSCCRELCDVGRNLTDGQLRLLGEKGGVCGINFVPGFLEKGSENAKISAIVRHMEHAANVAGVDALAFGSDFDGFTGEIEFDGCSGMPDIIHALGSVFHESEIEKICFGNALRLFRDNFG